MSSACLYAARYEFVHNRAHNIQPEEQTQISELIHYVSTLLPHLQRKLLKKLNSFHWPKSLREAMDVTMDIEVEHQITQPEQQLIIMETCCEEPPMEETYTTEEVQTRSQAQKQGQQQHQGSYSQFLRNQNSGQKSSKEIKTTTNQIMDWVTSLNTTREIAKTMATNLCIRDNTNLFQIKLLCNSLESILA